MGSTNKHWPSLFKSKPTCASAHHHQRQHEINQSSILSGHCQKPSIYTSGTEKTPEQKPRWNPKPEQIQILESIFNSGMVNPPRDEICRIRDQLQVYGQVGDANVFYWFQNRKSRSKHKQRHLKCAAARSNSKPCSASAIVATVPPPPTKTTSSSSSSSDHSSSGSDKQILSFTAPKQLSPGNLSTFFDLPDTLVQAPVMKPGLGLGAPTFLPTISSTYANLSNEFIAGIEAGATSLWSGLLVQGFTRKDDIPENGLEMLAVLGSVTDASLPPAFAPNYITTTTAAHATFNDMEEVARSTVFIDEVAYEVMAKPLNIKEAFGENTVLVHSSGHPVLTDESGLTLRPLDHGSSYYLLQVQ